MRVTLPVPVLALAGEGLACLGALTWRFRSAAAPAGDGGGKAGRGRIRPDGRLEHAIYALWHEDLLPLAVLHAGRGAAVLASRHRDGEVLVRVLGRLGYVAARGSSTRGGAEGLRELIRAGREGRPLAITPDGPRGPRRRCKAGIVRTAAATGLPVIPAAAAATVALRLPTWDRFLVPAPGSRVYVSHGPPLRIPADAGEEETAAWAERVGAAIEAEARRCRTRAEGARSSRGA